MHSTRLMVSMVSALALSLAAPACGGDASSGGVDGVTRVETLVQPISIPAGGRAQVQCAAVDKRGQRVESATNFSVVVSPADGITFDGLIMTATHAGLVSVACQYATLVDATPEFMTVTAGPPTHTVMTVAKSPILASESADTTCYAADAYGNDTGLARTVVAEPADIAVRDGFVIGTRAGDFVLTCVHDGLAPTTYGHASVTVQPGPMVALGLALEPERLSYGISDPAKVVGVGLDVQGNVTTRGVALTNIAAAPDGHAALVGPNRDLVSFDLEGRYTISAQSAADTALTASIDVVVDQTPPVITLTSPARGTVHDTATFVTVAGTVSDNLGEVESLTVNGVEARIADNGGAFSVEFPLEYGLDLIDVVATDPYGLAGLATRAAEKSTQYIKMDNPTVEKDGVQSGGVIFLMPELFDDGNHTEAKRDDLASLMLDIIRTVDLTTLVPDPLTKFSCIGGDCHIRFTGVTFSASRVAITLTPGRLHLHLELDNMAANIALDAPCGVPGCPSNPAILPGAATADRLTADFDIALSIINGTVEASTENATVVFTNFDVVLDDPTGLFSAVVALAVGLVKDPLVSALENLMGSLIQDQLGPALSGLFNALFIDEDLDVPPAIGSGPHNTVKLQLTPQAIDIGAERAQVRLAGLAYAVNPVRPFPSLGSIGHDGCRPFTALTYPSPAPLVVALHDSFINQILFAIWEGGTISIDAPAGSADDLISGFPVTDLALSVQPYLPPVFNSCDGVEKVQIGDLYLDATFDLGGPVHLAMWLQAEAAVNVVVGETPEGALEARIEVGAIDPLTVELITNEGYFAGDDAAVIELVKSVLVPQLLGSLGDTARFQLPRIDLHAQSPAFPEGTTVDFDVRGTSRDNAYLTVLGGLK